MIPLGFLALLAITAFGALLTAHWLAVVAVAFCLLWLIAVLVGVAGWWFTRLPTGFLPTEDQGYAFVAGEALQRADRDGLQVDAPGPCVPHAAEDSPVGFGVRPIAVEVGADRGGAVRQRAAQTKVEARFDVGFGVIFGSVGDDGGLGTGMRAVRVRLPRPG